MTPSAARDEAITVFSTIQEVMVREGDYDWLPGIRAILDVLRSESDPMQALKDAFTTYQTMMSGAGTFSDYFLWRDDSDVRARVNEAFDALRARGWSLLLAAKLDELQAET